LDAAGHRTVPLRGRTGHLAVWTGTQLLVRGGTAHVLEFAEQPVLVVPYTRPGWAVAWGAVMG
jgi:hypothetical protein